MISSWVERDPRIVKENLRPSSRVKSFLAMIGPEAKISKDGTSAIPFHLATLACHLACIGCNYELFNSTPSFPFFPNIPLPREKELRIPSSSPRYLDGRRKVIGWCCSMRENCRSKEFSLEPVGWQIVVRWKSSAIKVSRVFEFRRVVKCRE